jgi:hypothetical protein
MKAATLLAMAAVSLPLAAAWGQAFAPGGNTVSLAVTGTTARVQVQTSNNNKAMRLFNSGTAIVFIVCGDVASTATLAAGMPVAPGTVEVVTCAQTHIAAISASAVTLYVTPGSGL